MRISRHRDQALGAIFGLCDAVRHFAKLEVKFVNDPRNRAYPLSHLVGAGLLTLCTLLSGCGWTKNVDLAKDAVEMFHSQFNAEQYDQIYAAADEKFRATTRESDFTKLLQSVHQKLGVVQRSERRNTRVVGSGTEMRITLVYDTGFVGGASLEQFTWRIDVNRARLYHYRINASDGLIR